jgi:hypothetical protein
MLTSNKRWPPNILWGLHDFTQGSAQGGNNYFSLM